MNIIHLDGAETSRSQDFSCFLLPSAVFRGACHSNCDLVSHYLCLLSVLCPSHISRFCSLFNILLIFPIATVVTLCHKSSQVVTTYHKLSQVIKSRHKSSQFVSKDQKSSPVIIGCLKGSKVVKSCQKSIEVLISLYNSHHNCS